MECLCFHQDDRQCDPLLILSEHPGFVLFWSDGVQYCSVRDISSKGVLQLQRRADAKGSGMMTPIIIAGNVLC